MKSLALAAALVLLVGSASAQMAHQFTLIGHIESLTVDDQTNPLSSAKMKVHGVEVVLPRNLIIQMPARYLTTKDIVDLNPASPGVNSGLALQDTPAPLAAYEATVVGNIVGDQYIAGLIWISQHSLATGAGFIKEITPQGEIHVVANPDPAVPAPLVASLPDTLRRLDPVISVSTSVREPLMVLPAVTETGAAVVTVLARSPPVSERLAVAGMESAALPARVPPTSMVTPVPSPENAQLPLLVKVPPSRARFV